MTVLVVCRLCIIVGEKNYEDKVGKRVVYVEGQGSGKVKRGQSTLNSPSTEPINVNMSNQ